MAGCDSPQSIAYNRRRLPYLSPPAESDAEGSIMKMRLRTLGVVAVLFTCSWQIGGQVREFRPVSDAMLQRPEPGDWLHWRRTLDGWAHSPLNQINTQNAGRLQLVWGWTLAPGASEPGPVVHDGVMYVAQASGVVHALDAASGDLLWEYAHDVRALA